MAEFGCATCGKSFQVAEDVLAKFPGWQPRFCLEHRASRGAAATATKAPAAPRPAGSPAPVQQLPPGRAHGSKTFRSTDTDSASLTPEQVLERYHGGPQSGVFTDGGARPNPGKGGWGFVYVEAGQILAQGSGGEAHTTNNRMELSAIIGALEHLPNDARVTLFSDSDLCVKTLTLWAKSWAARGWRRKDGEIANLDLVQRAYELARAHPGVKLTWIKAHDGTRWNEYVDALATQALRS